jgi:hypothetical protein
MCKGLGAIRAKIGPTSDVNTASEHVFIPENNPHCISSQMYALFIEFYYALGFFVFF